MKFNPYSISKLGCYDSCPMQFEFKYVNKVKVPFTMNVALYKGSYIHAIIENSYNYDTEFKINPTFTQEEKDKARIIVEDFEACTLGQKYKRIAETPQLQPIHEEKFAIKVVQGKLELCGYGDKEAWLRGAIDFQYKNSMNRVAYNIDWKSGRNKSQDDTFGIDQSMAYSIYLMLKYPDINMVVSRFVFVEHSEEKEILYTRDKFQEYVKHFYNKTKVLEADNIYEAKTSALCNWCDFYNHGICKVPDEKEKEAQKIMGSNISLDF